MAEGERNENRSCRRLKSTVAEAIVSYRKIAIVRGVDSPDQFDREHSERMRHVRLCMTLPNAQRQLMRDALMLNRLPYAQPYAVYVSLGES